MSNTPNQHEKDYKEIIDIEEYAREEKVPPQGHSYRIRIDKIKYDVSIPSLIGRQLLELANKIPIEQFRIYKKLRGGQSQEIPYDQVTFFTEPGVERFMTIALDQTEG